MSFPPFVKIVEVGPRDGLQNEAQIVPTEIKLELIKRLAQAGLKTIEATSFVSPKWVPQMADHEEIMLRLERDSDIHYPVLVPNMKGLENALKAGVKAIAVFTAASETFCKKNINCTIAESLEQFAQVINVAKDHNILVRGYVSCVLGCPYEGEITPQQVSAVAADLFELGCYEISLGDTIGVGTPLKAQEMIEVVSDKIPLNNLAVHFHNTYGQGVVNVYAALEAGIATIDCSVAGLGGCPYAKGATGNVATEDVLYLLNGLGIETGVDLQKLFEAGQFICGYLKKTPESNVARALQTKNGF